MHSVVFSPPYGGEWGGIPPPPFSGGRKTFPPLFPTISESSEIFPPHIFSSQRQFYLVLDFGMAFPKRRKAQECKIFAPAALEAEKELQMTQIQDLAKFPPSFSPPFSGGRKKFPLTFPPHF